MKKCTQCGVENRSNARFCHECGYDFAQAAKGGEGKKSCLRILGFALLSLIFLVAFGLIIWLLSHSGPDDTEGSKTITVTPTALVTITPTLSPIPTILAFPTKTISIDKPVTTPSVYSSPILPDTPQPTTWPLNFPVIAVNEFLTPFFPATVTPTPDLPTFTPIPSLTPTLRPCHKVIQDGIIFGVVVIPVYLYPALVTPTDNYDENWLVSLSVGEVLSITEITCPEGRSGPWLHVYRDTGEDGWVQASSLDEYDDKTIYVEQLSTNCINSAFAVQQTGTVIRDEVILRSSPVLSGIDNWIRQLRKGEKVTVLRIVCSDDASGPWLLVKLSTGEKGWVKEWWFISEGVKQTLIVPR